MADPDADIVGQNKWQLVTGFLFLCTAVVNVLMAEEVATLSFEEAILWALVGTWGILIYASERVRRWLSRLLGSPIRTLIVSGVCFGLAYVAFRIDVQSAAVILVIFGASVLLSSVIHHLKKTWRSLRTS